NKVRSHDELKLSVTVKLKIISIVFNSQACRSTKTEWGCKIKKIEGTAILRE
ncbi:hypothetical protein L9F63_017683, partial [Diploptera punctata]